MKPALLEHLRCPKCHSLLRLDEAASETIQTGSAAQFVEIVDGMLTCEGCDSAYAIAEGVPCLGAVATPDHTARRTASSFGYLWAQSVPGPDVYDTSKYHFAKMEQSLSLLPPRGLVLDAGCGDGIDLAIQARRADVEAIGVEISEGGCRAAHPRARLLDRAHVVQADVCRLPFADCTFDLAYSYGMLHHLRTPELGLGEIVRVVKPGARVVAYLYEDFSERGVMLRWLLGAANGARALTTRLPHSLLYGLCRLASPVVFMTFTLPAIFGRRVSPLAPLVAGLPFRHGKGPFSLIGDLYDRFSAPVERRYSRASAQAFFAESGLEQVTAVAERGWMLLGVKPGGQRPQESI